MNSLDKFVFQLACKLEHTLSTTSYIQKPFSDTDPIRVINLGNNYSIGVIKIQSLFVCFSNKVRVTKTSFDSSNGKSIGN